MNKVAFISMENGTKEEYKLLEQLEVKAAKGLGNRVLVQLEGISDILGGYQINRFEHSLQSATRAYNDGLDTEFIVMSLLHDIGDGIAPFNHGEFAASLMRPYVSDRTHWILKYHGLFQTYYYAHHLGMDRNLRDKHKDSPFYEDAKDFCHNYDQNCFDPSYKNLPIEFFVPMVNEVFDRVPKQFDRR